MKMHHHYTFYFLLILIANATFCEIQNKKEANFKKKQLEMDYQEVLALIKKCKEFIVSDKPFDRMRGKGAIGMLTIIAAAYETHVAFNDILTPEKKKLTSEDQEAINEYLRTHSYSKENETLMADYFNCLLQEQAPQYDIHSPQQGNINIPKKCYPLQTKMQKSMAKENMVRDGIEINEKDF